MGANFSNVDLNLTWADFGTKNSYILKNIDLGMVTAQLYLWPLYLSPGIAWVLVIDRNWTCRQGLVPKWRHMVVFVVNNFYLIIFIDCDPAMALWYCGQLDPDVTTFGAAEEALGVDDGEDAAVDAGPFDNHDWSVIHFSYLELSHPPQKMMSFLENRVKPEPET